MAEAELRQVALSDVIFDPTIYPRLRHDLTSDSLIVMTLRFLGTLDLSADAVANVMPMHPSLKNKQYRCDVLSFFDNKCFVCGYRAFIDVHHVRHKTRTGSDRIDNLVVLCPNHHKEWHYIENTFFVGVGSASEVNARANRAIGMDWFIPDFVMRNNIAPFLIQLARKANHEPDRHDTD